MNQPVPNNLYPLANALTSSSPFIEHFDTRDPTAQDTQFQVQQRWWNKTLNNEWILVGFTSAGGIVQAIWEPISSASVVETLTGNTGGPVGPDVTNTINVVGDTTTINIAGNPGTNTLTVSASGSIATSYVEDTGTAVPIAGVLHINGTGGITTTGATNVVTIDGSGIVSTTVYTEDTGTATPSANNLNVFGGTASRDINTSGSGSTIHIDLNNAITLGDLSTIAAGSPAITVASGDIELTASNQAAATNQMIRFKTNTGQDGNISMFLNSVFIGQLAGNTTMTPGVAIFNVGIGAGSMANVTTSASSTGVGYGSLGTLTSGNGNTCIGYLSGSLITIGLGNTCIGDGTGNVLVSGNRNTLLGQLAGAAYTSSESDNVAINSGGVVGESNVLRIGSATGGGVTQLNKAFISGIRGITTGNADAVAVLVDSANQLGTVSSTKALKQDIQDMGQESDPILKLRPVTFVFKDDPEKFKRVGLIAEEVEELYPLLVAHDENGKPWSVKYHELPVLLLNELQKLQRRVEFLEWQVNSR